jgi:hypothetical protein
MEFNNMFIKFRKFLQDEIKVSTDELATVIGQSKGIAPIPMLLWQYGLVSLEQLDRIFDWLDNQPQLYIP